MAGCCDNDLRLYRFNPATQEDCRNARLCGGRRRVSLECRILRHPSVQSGPGLPGSLRARGRQILWRTSLRKPKRVRTDQYIVSWTWSEYGKNEDSVLNGPFIILDDARENAIVSAFKRLGSAAPEMTNSLRPVAAGDVDLPSRLARRDIGRSVRRLSTTVVVFTRDPLRSHENDGAL